MLGSDAVPGRGTTFACALALIVVGWPTPVPAAPQEAETAPVRALVMPLTVEGEAPPEAIEAVDEAFARGLSDGAYTVVHPNEGTTCADRACLTDLAQSREATHIVRGVLRAFARDYEIEIQVLDAGDGKELARTDGFCDTCGVAELEEFLTDQGVRVGGKLEAFAARPAMLIVETDPPGALVYVDDEAVGTTPLERELLAGPRTLRVTLAGHAPYERSVELVEGVEESIRVELDPVPTDLDKDRPARRPWALGVGGASLGLGVAGLGAGVALLVLDDDPVPGRCHGDAIDVDGDCKYLYDTLGGGIGLTVGGAVLTGLGVGLLIWNAKHGRGDRHARVRVGPRGVSLVAAF
jgi:hypothetical protein